MAVTVLALLLVSAVPLHAAYARSGYSEKLNVYLAGSDALWFFTFGGLNGSSHLQALESAPGLSWYNITAMSTTGWQSDFQIFGPRGYNVLPVPYVPSQGMFLTVGSDSYPDASKAAAALDPYLQTNFVSYSNGTNTFVFASPVSFNTLIPATILKNFLPTAEHGFASAISASSFLTTPSPFVVLEGAGGSSGFSHTLVVGSIAYSALNSGGVPGVLSYFGQSVSSLKASNNSASSVSVVQIDALDGIIKASPPATVKNDGAAFTGSYTLKIAAGKQISAVNATVAQQPAGLLATRAVTDGVVRTGKNVTVTLSFTNLSPVDVISNITYADNWWKGATGFKFLDGVDNVSSASLAAGQSTTPVYRLQYTGTATGPFTIPASLVRYTYQIGGVSFNGSTTIDPIRLSLNQDDAVVYALARPVGSQNRPVGSPQSVNITVVNVGSLPASSVVVGGKPIPGLEAKTPSSPGGTETVTVTLSAPGLTDLNVTKSFAVTYQDPSGTSLQATSNVVSAVFTHVGVVTGFPALTVGAKINTMSAALTNLTISFVTSNFGAANMTSFSATGSLPPRLGCGKIVGVGLSCAGDQVSIEYALVNKSSTERPYMMYNLTAPVNYIIGPFAFQATTLGNAVTGSSNLVAIPTGLQLNKEFTPGQLFGGMSSTVAAVATNAGPFSFYNFTVTSAIDSFDRLSSSVPLSKTVPTLAPGKNANVSYPVSMSQVSGNLSATAVTGSFYFGGIQFSQQGLRSKVQIYQPLSVSIVTTPGTPEEGKSFLITFEISNPSGVSVSNVDFSLPIPSGLSLSNPQNVQVSPGRLTVTFGSLAPGSSATASVTAVASSGITIPFSDAKLTFSYGGTPVSGVVPKSSGIGISENVTTRYLIPTAIILLVTLAVAFYMRRLGATSPASQK